MAMYDLRKLPYSIKVAETGDGSPKADSPKAETTAAKADSSKAETTAAMQRYGVFGLGGAGLGALFGLLAGQNKKQIFLNSLVGGTLGAGTAYGMNEYFKAKEKEPPSATKRLDYAARKALFLDPAAAEEGWWSLPSSATMGRWTKRLSLGAGSASITANILNRGRMTSDEAAYVLAYRRNAAQRLMAKKNPPPPTPPKKGNRPAPLEPPDSDLGLQRSRDVYRELDGHEGATHHVANEARIRRIVRSGDKDAIAELANIGVIDLKKIGATGAATGSLHTQSRVPLFPRISGSRPTPGFWNRLKFLAGRIPKKLYARNITIEQPTGNWFIDTWRRGLIPKPGAEVMTPNLAGRALAFNRRHAGKIPAASGAAFLVGRGLQAWGDSNNRDLYYNPDNY